MSKFSVLVVGEDVEAQLEGFGQFEVLGEENRYIVDLDITNKVRAEIEKNKERGETHSLQEVLNNFGFGKSIIDFKKDSNFSRSKFKYGYAIVDGDKLVKVIKRTNLNYKWDWYTIGGSWSDLLILKTGGTSISAKFENIDFEAMYRNRIHKRIVNYKRFWRLMKNKRIPLKYTYKDMFELGSFPFLNEEQKRELYFNQEALRYKDKRVQEIVCIEDKFFLSEAEYEDFYCTEGEYYNKYFKREGLTFAIVKDGKWYDKGEVRFHDRLLDEKRCECWGENYISLLENINSSEHITVVECHI